MRLSAVNFIRKIRSKSFNNGIVYNRVGFECICATISRQYTGLFYKRFTRATESGWTMAGCNFRNTPPNNVLNCYRWKIYIFWQKNSKSSDFYYLEPGLYPSITDIVEAMNSLIQERHNHSEICITVKVSRRTQRLRFTLQRKGLVLHSSVPIWDTFSEVMLVMNLEWGWDGNDLTNQNLLTTLSGYTLSWYTPTWLSTISLATRKLHCCVAFLLFRSSWPETLKLLDSTWTIRHLATCNSDRCSKTLFIVFTLTWETRALKN